MSDRTLRTINIVTVLFLVLVLALSVCLVTISNKQNIIVDKGSDNDNADAGVFNGVLQTTSGSMDGVDPAMPDYATAIGTQDELRAFIENPDIKTKMYGYLTSDITLDNWYVNGSVQVMTGNKTLDGRGWKIAIATAVAVPSNVGDYTTWQKFNRFDVNPSEKVWDKRTNTSGLFIAMNEGEIKNVNFTYALQTYLSCYGFIRTAYGIVMGVNRGSIENAKLTMSSGSLFHVSKDKGANPEGSTSSHTVIVGGFAGINDAAMKNIHADINGSLQSHARYFGKAGNWIGTGKIKGACRAIVAGIVGATDNADATMKEFVVSGNGKMEGIRSGEANSEGGASAHVASVLGSNNTGTGSIAAGSLERVIDYFTGEMSGSTYGHQGGTVECPDNTSDILRLARLGNKLYNCNCDHNKNQTYSTLTADEGIAYDITFSKTEGMFIDYTASVTPEKDAEGALLFDHQSITRTSSDFNITETPTTIGTGLQGNKSYDGSLVAYSEANKYYSAANFGIGYIVDMKYSAGNAEFAYNGAAQDAPYTLTYKNGTAAAYDKAKTGFIHYSADMDILAKAPTLPSSYSMSAQYADVEGKAIEDVAYYDATAGVIAYTDPTQQWEYAITLGSGSVNVPEDKWYNDYTYAFTLESGIEGAIDNLQYSNDGGTTWVDAAGSSYKLTDANTSTTATEFVFRGLKGATVVTFNTNASTIKFDNIKAVLNNLVFTVDGAVHNIDNWTYQDITIAFKPYDAHTGVKSVAASSEDGAIVMDKDEAAGVYSFDMTSHMKYTVTVVDNADNSYIYELNAPIDKETPTLVYNSNGYTADDEVYDEIRFSMTATYGAGGAKIEYAFTDVSAEYKEIDADGKKEFDFFIREAVNSNLRFRITSSAGLKEEYDFGVVVIKSYKITVTFENMDITGIATDKEYDGKTSMAGNYQVRNLVYGDNDTALPAEEYENLEIVGTYADKNIGEGKTITYTLRAKTGHEFKYEFVNAEHSFSNGKVTAKDITVTISNHDKTYYDNNPRSFDYKIDGIVAGDESEVTYTVATDVTKESNAGVYDIWLQDIVATNYNVVYHKNVDESNSGTGAFVVRQRPVSVEFGGYVGLRYSGSEAQITAHYYDVNHNKISMPVTYDRTAIDAGDYIATTVFEDPNYVNVTGDNDIEFSILATTPTINIAEQTVGYNGKPQEIKINMEYIAEYTLTYNGSVDIPVSPGVYKVVVKVDASGNYSESIAYSKLTITKASFSGISMAPKSVPYTAGGSKLTITGTLPEGENAVVEYNINDNVISVGKHEFTAKITAPNYKTLELKATLTIENRKFSGITFADGSFVYDGTAKKISLAGVPDTATVVYTINGQRADGFDAVSAGTYYVKATVSQDLYDTVVYTATLTVTPATITGFTFDEEESNFGYDGTEHSVFVKGELDGYTVSYQRNKAVDAGRHFSTAIISRENYQSLTLKTFWFVSAVPVEVTYDGLTEVAVGATPNIKANFLDINGDMQILNVDLSGVNFAKKGEYTAVPIFANGNYIADYSTSSVTITVGNTSDEDEPKSNTAVIVGASVGGGVGGLAIIGGLIAFFVLRKKKSILG